MTIQPFQRNDPPLSAGQIELHPGSNANEPLRVCQADAGDVCREFATSSVRLEREIREKKAELESQRARAAEIQQEYRVLLADRDERAEEIARCEAELAASEARLGQIASEVLSGWREKGVHDHFLEHGRRKLLAETLRAALPTMKSELVDLEKEIAAFRKEHGIGQQGISGAS